MILNVALLLTLPLNVVHAIAWPGLPTSLVASKSAAPQVPARMKEAIQSLQHVANSRKDVNEWINTDLNEGNASFDCSESSLKTWTDHCENLAESSNARTELAAALTMCEIKSMQNLNVPRECQDWIKNDGVVGLCVEAFSRSPQHWTSYSNLLRNIVQTCYALGKWHDTAAIKDLYRNISLNQQEFMQKIVHYESKRHGEEERLQKRKDEWQDTADSTLHDIRTNVKITSSILVNYEDLSDAISAELKKQSQEAANHHTGIQKVYDVFDNTLMKLPTLLRDQLQHQAVTAQESLELAIKSTAQSHKQNLDGHVAKHAQALSDLAAIQAERHSQGLSIFESIVIKIFDELAHVSKSLAETDTQIQSNNEASKALHKSMATFNGVIEKSTAAVITQQAIHEELLLKHITSTASLVNTTNAVESRLVEATRSVNFGNWVSNFEWLSVLFAVMPYSSRIFGLIKTMNIRYTAFGVGVGLIILSNPYISLVAIPAATFQALQVPYFNLFRRAGSRAKTAPWRTAQGKQFLSTV